MTKLKFLGTGSLEGIPSPLCSCSVCSLGRKGTKDQRLRSSMLMKFDDGESLIIDCTPDFRTQLEKFKFPVRNIFISHGHFDHFYGLGELSYITTLYDVKPTIYGKKDVLDYMRMIFSFIKLDYKDLSEKTFKVGENILELIPVTHAKNTSTTGLIFRDTAIIPEIYQIDSVTKEYLKNKKLKYLVCDAAYYDVAVFKDHFTIFDAIKLGKEINAKNIIVTNIWHKNKDHMTLSRKHPEVMVAYDGMEIEL